MHFCSFCPDTQSKPSVYRSVENQTDRRIVKIVGWYFGAIRRSFCNRWLQIVFKNGSTPPGLYVCRADAWYELDQKRDTAQHNFCQAQADSSSSAQPSRKLYQAFHKRCPLNGAYQTTDPCWSLSICRMMVKSYSETGVVHASLSFSSSPRALSSLASSHSTIASCLIANLVLSWLSAFFLSSRSRRARFLPKIDLHQFRESIHGTFHPKKSLTGLPKS